MDLDLDDDSTLDAVGKSMSSKLVAPGAPSLGSPSAEDDPKGAGRKKPTGKVKTPEDKERAKLTKTDNQIAGVRRTLRELRSEVALLPNGDDERPLLEAKIDKCNKKVTSLQDHLNSVISGSKT
eukprot:7179088-Alexandrium_andersonii.AAC.1